MEKRINKPTFAFLTIGTQEIRIECKIDRGDGYIAGAFGKTPAEALLRAAVLFYNRECQEFNRAEYEHEQAEKNDYSKMSEKRYKAKRKSPVETIETDYLLDISMFYSQMKINNDTTARCIRDFENMNEYLKDKERNVPFMVENGGQK